MCGASKVIQKKHTISRQTGRLGPKDAVTSVEAERMMQALNKQG